MLIEEKTNFNSLAYKLITSSFPEKIRLDALVDLITMLGNITRGTIIINNLIISKLIKSTCYLRDSFERSRQEKELLNIGEAIFLEIRDHQCLSFTTKSNLKIALTVLKGIKVNFTVKKQDLLYPRIVMIETQAICNAKCSFCDYKELERKGIKMSSENLNSILNQLSKIPENHSFTVQPYRVSEPFLDKRLISICHRIFAMHPKAKVSIISNGSYIPNTLTKELSDLCRKEYFFERKFQKSLPRLVLSFSLNESDPVKYKELMKLDFHRTCSNLDRLHEMFTSNQLPFPIKLTRVSTDPSEDKNFMEFCRRRYPYFKAFLLKLNDWTGSNKFSQNVKNFSATPLSAYQKLPCQRWFDLSILATGKVALCCMDSGVCNFNLGDAFKENMLDIYRRKMNSYIPNTLKRGSSIDPCKGCTYSGPMSQGEHLLKTNRKNMWNK